MKFYRAYSFKQFYLAVTSLSRLENTAQRKKESMMMLNFVMLVLSLSRFSTRDVRTFIVCIRTVAVSSPGNLLARLHASSASRIMISLYESEDCINYKTHSERRWHTCASICSRPSPIANLARHTNCESRRNLERCEKV